MPSHGMRLMDRVITGAASAATDSTQWNGVVRDLKDLFNARTVVLFTPEPAADVQPFEATIGDLSEEGIHDYFANWAHDDAWLRAVSGKGFFQRAGEARFSQEFLADSTLTKTAFYNDWAQRYSAEQSLALKVTDALDPTAPVMHLSFFRRLADEPFTKQDRTRLQLLWPHLQRAARGHWALQSVRQFAPAIEATLEVLPLPIWVLRDDGKIDFANRLARGLAREGIWVREMFGSIDRIAQLDGRWLRNEIFRRSHLGEQVGHSCAVSVVSRGHLLRGTLHLLPVKQSSLYAAAWPHARSLLMLQTSSSAETDHLWTSHISAKFGLTDAQAMILKCLGDGLSVQCIATRLHIKVGTVRAHIHALLSRTEMKTQADLVALALGH